MLLLSTQPLAKPSFIVQRTKGRLQNLLMQQNITWRRNFRLTSVGDANAPAVEKYVEQQLEHQLITYMRPFVYTTGFHPVNSLWR